MLSSLEHFIAEKLSSTNCRFISIGGGSINDTYRIESDHLHFFCKINSAKKYPCLFEKEKSGLEFLANTNTIKTPQVIWCGEASDQQVLILEWIDPGAKTKSFWKKFGEGLSALHGSRRSSDGNHQTKFGYPESNYMGALTQINDPCENWVEFFITCRLQPQINLAIQNRLLASEDEKRFEALYKKLESIFPREKPAALHGDLWSGNYLCSKNAEPVLIDPAVYYGHRSIDLGMTKLFGGFDQVFYEAYRYHSPLPNNFDEQADVCNLYPLLIHLNLFGSGYLSSIRGILKRYS